MAAKKVEASPTVDNWSKAVEELRGLVPRAVQVLAAGLESDDPKVQQAAALHVLRAVGMYGKDLEPIESRIRF
jgi:uncharacterized Ntn-hydrolase superfamily protein